MKTPESHEKTEICKYLDSIGAWYFKPVMNGFGKAGVPDIVACFGGGFIAIEVKREGKNPTSLQNRRMIEIDKAGGAVFWGTAERVIPDIEAWHKVVSCEL